MDTSQLVQLPDGSLALIQRTMTFGEATLILLVAALLFLELYKLWRNRDR